MDLNELNRNIEESKPKLIYISGKTSTGKTTLAKQICEKLGYAHVETDEIVESIHFQPKRKKFTEVYRFRNEMQLINEFTRRLRNEIKIQSNDHNGVVFEGAIATNETLKEVVSPWGDEFVFVYLHPSSIENYVNRLKARFLLSSPHFNSGLPSTFWDEFSQEQLARFYSSRIIRQEDTESITRYAKRSARESEERLKMFKKEFIEILVVEV